MTAFKLKLILAAALFAVPVPAFAQSAPLVPAWLNAYDKDVCSERRPEVSRRVCLREAIRERQRELCRQEIIGRNEGLIATAPTNWEVDAGISVANPTPACHRRNMP